MNPETVQIIAEAVVAVALIALVAFMLWLGAR